jgi:hypothetical protein
LLLLSLQVRRGSDKELAQNLSRECAAKDSEKCAQWRPCTASHLVDAVMKHSAKKYTRVRVADEQHLNNKFKSFDAMQSEAPLKTETKKKRKKKGFAVAS